MYCLRCGNETSENKVFCDSCLQSMDQYPVKPGTTVQLPRQNSTNTAKKQSASRRTISAEEQVIYLKKIIKLMGFLLVIAVAALAVTVYQLLY